MKIYVLEAFYMEPYDSYSWPAKAFRDKRTAEAFAEAHKTEVFDENLEEYECGWAYSSHITELELV